MSRTITLSEARAMASDADLIEAGDVGRVAILPTVDGQEFLVDLAPAGTAVDDAAHEWARRMGEDDEDIDAAVIVAD